MRAERPGGDRLCSEKYVIEPQRRDVRACGVMGNFDVFANVLLFTPPANACQYSRKELLASAPSSYEKNVVLR